MICLVCFRTSKGSWHHFPDYLGLSGQTFVPCVCVFALFVPCLQRDLCWISSYYAVQKMSKSSSSKSSSSPPCNLSSNPASRPHLQLQVLHSTCELTSVTCHLLHHCYSLAICRLRFRSFFKSIPIGIPASQHPSLKFSICIS